MVYYVLTNSATGSGNGALVNLPTPGIVSGAGAADEGVAKVVRLDPAGGIVAMAAAESYPGNYLAQRGHPMFTEASRRLLAELRSDPVAAAAVEAGQDYNIGATETMIAYAELGDDEDGVDVNGDGEVTFTDVEVEVRLTAKRSQDPWAFYLWIVEEAAGTDYDALIPSDDDLTNQNIQLLADIFMDPAATDDIFDLVTGVFGDPWGEHPYSDLVSSEERNLHVLLYDIEGDGIPGDGDARIVGFFYFGDNVVGGGFNELVMFHMDASLFGAEDSDPSDGWQITDYWPSQVVSTLAHEFQHMIHFYQRGVVSPDGSQDGMFETWMDESNSMMAEDLVAQAIENRGPRGVPHTDGSAGSSGNTYGRLPDFNEAGFATELTAWQNTLDHYSVSYAFGAYLSRAYTPQVLVNLYGDGSANAASNQALEYTTGAVSDAVTAIVGSRVTFAELLRRWGVAYLVSDDTNAPERYRINRGTWFESTVNGENYRLGSINAYNYYPSVQGFNATSGAVPVSAGANTYAFAGTVPAGGYTVSVSLPADTTLTVLTR